MPVDRERRDQVADSLASFMQGEADWYDFRNVCEQMRAEVKESVEADTALKGVLNSVIFDDSIGYFSENAWQLLGRYCAFLKSDIGTLNDRWPDSTPPSSRRAYAIARWHLFALAIPLYLAHLFGWWIFAAACAISSAMYYLWKRRFDATFQAELDAKRTRLLQLYPFATQEEWQAHKAVLDQYQIPNYDRNIHGPPARDALAKFGLAALYLFIAAIALVSYLLWVLVWPIYLIGNVLPKKGQPPGRTLK